MTQRASPSEARIVVGVDGSECGSRALEFAVKEAARWDALLHVVSAYEEMPAVRALVVRTGLLHESAEAVVSDALRRAEELEPTVVVKGETVLDFPGPALVGLSKGATARGRHTWPPRADQPPLRLRLRACRALCDRHHDRGALTDHVFAQRRQVLAPARYAVTASDRGRRHRGRRRRKSQCYRRSLAIDARQQEEQAAHTRAVLLERDRFTHAAACTVERIVKPTFADVAERLNDHGGGGLVEERPAAGRHGQRVTLWMSLEGPVVAPPRADRNPYIQLEIDVRGRHVGLGGQHVAQARSEPTHRTLHLGGLTTESLIQRAVGVLRRSVNLGSETEGETK